MSGRDEKNGGGSLADRVRGDFDILSRRPDLVYLDTAATALKPNAVLQARSEGAAAASAARRHHGAGADWRRRHRRRRRRHGGVAR